MKISGYENIEIFNNTQGFGINKYENQILRERPDTGFFKGDPSFQLPVPAVTALVARAVAMVGFIYREMYYLLLRETM
jgi:hypothetical protein